MKKRQTIKQSIPRIILNDKIRSAIKSWFKKAADFTKEESKVLSIRAQEAGKLTTLNAKKYKLKHDYEKICAEIGQQILGSTTLNKDSNIINSPKIQELVDKANQIERELKLLAQEIESCKKESDDRVNNIHRKAA